ncbi:MAG: hypothetical protein NVSMB22_15460 [Chloroflexota bacterium]
MPRSTRTDMTTLLQEARAIELFASDVEVPVDRTERYWRISADLITLVADIETFAAAYPDASNDNPSVLGLRRRLRQVAASLAELSLE